MTIREYYQSVLDAHISDEMDTATTAFLAKMDERNAKRKSAESKEKRETASRRESVLATLSDVPQFAESIAESTTLSVGQVRSALSALVREEIADKTEVKVGKSRKMAYTLHRA